ncbi:MAG: hypothetical protein QG660_1947 [Pseudomonadota bacterium]|nr:hypothetical protein [Pseudomonadota bacterium]MDQ5918832.1 hypothetical protein [Pseudomonadota bacterium]
MAKTIKAFTSLLGGYAYRVTSDGGVVNYQERGPNASKFTTKASESLESFEVFAKATGLFDAYGGDNPAIVCRRIRQLNQ